MSQSKKRKGSGPRAKANPQIPISSIHGTLAVPEVHSPYLDGARDYPIYGCWIMEGWQNMGITPVIVARLQDNDRILFGNYMVDFYCLGIKDVYTRANYARERFENALPELCNGTPVPCSVELAHELIYGALEYAKELGFDPHPDFYNMKADQILDPPDAHPRDNGLEFGLDGVPFYVAGPYDSETKKMSILNTLERTCGPGNYDFLAGAEDLSGDWGED
jgi:hypothetical protein